MSLMRPQCCAMKSSVRKNKKITPQVAALNFFAEAGLLKRVKRSGWWVAGIKDPETVAEHCFRCAIIGYYIAHCEGVDPFRVVTQTLFNDIHEARINDLHKMGHHYIDFRPAEQKAFADQIVHLEKKVKRALQIMREDYDRQLSRESIVARDADILECLIQAKEYVDLGFPVARTFFKRAPDYLKTATARKLWQQALSWNSHAWWQNVVKFER